MDNRAMHDRQALFDVSLQEANRRIGDLRGDGSLAADGLGPGVTARRAGVRYAIGVRLLALGATLVADEPLRPRRTA